MRPIEAVMQVGEDGKLTIELPEEATPGRYKVVFALSKLLGLKKAQKKAQKKAHDLMPEEDYPQAS